MVFGFNGVWVKHQFCLHRSCLHLKSTITSPLFGDGRRTRKSPDICVFFIQFSWSPIMSTSVFAWIRTEVAKPLRKVGHCSTILPPPPPSCLVLASLIKLLVLIITIIIIIIIIMNPPPPSCLVFASLIILLISHHPCLPKNCRN